MNCSKSTNIKYEFHYCGITFKIIKLHINHLQNDPYETMKVKLINFDNIDGQILPSYRYN